MSGMRSSGMAKKPLVLLLLLLPGLSVLLSLLAWWSLLLLLLMWPLPLLLLLAWLPVAAGDW
jgi:hypothetical protein